jgi:hypothetical protein
MGTVVLTGPVEGQYTNWQAPGFEASPQERLDWVEEQIQEGEGRLEGQPSYKNLAKNIRIYRGIYSDKSNSKLVTNSLKYNIRKLSSTLSEVREIALYGSDAVQFKPMANIENKVAKALYLESQFPQQLKGALQYASVMGDGYLWVGCEQDDYGYGERKITFRPLGPMDVVATQVPSSGDIQDAYTVTIFDYMPIAMAHGKFPLFQSQLKPVTSTDIKSRLQAKRLDFTEQVRFGDQGAYMGRPVLRDSVHVHPRPTHKPHGTDDSDGRTGNELVLRSAFGRFADTFRDAGHDPDVPDGHTGRLPRVPAVATHHHRQGCRYSDARRTRL